MIVALYIVALVAANLLVAAFGPAFSIVNAFLLIGLDLSLRDKLHEQWQGENLVMKMGGLIVGASAISFLLNPATGQIAIASMVAFAIAMAADATVYQWLKDKEWFVKVNGSNAAGALTDSIVFPTIAFGGLLLPIVAGQFIAKLAGGFIWSVVINKLRK